MDEKVVVAGRFSQRFAYYDEPQVFKQLERVASAHQRSMAAEVRAAVRRSLEEQRRA